MIVLEKKGLMEQKYKTRLIGMILKLLIVVFKSNFVNFTAFYVLPDKTPFYYHIS